MSASITVRDTGQGRRYDVRYRRGGRGFKLERAGTFKTEREAKIRLRKVQDWLAAGLDPKAELARERVSSPELRHLAGEWLKSRRDVDTRTVDTYRNHVHHITQHFGDVEAQDVTVADVQEFIASLKLGAGTVTGVVGTLRMILDTTGDPVNVARSRLVRLPRIERKTLDPPTAAEALACFQRTVPTYRPHVVVLEQTGLRVSELLGLRPDDVDTARGLLRVRAETSKRDRPRWVEVPDWIVELVRFPLPGTRNMVWHAVNNGCKLAEVRPFRVHDLRHRRASLWHQTGVPAVELARRLGHAKPSMSLDVYSHVMPLDEIAVHDLVRLLR